MAEQTERKTRGPLDEHISMRVEAEEKERAERLADELGVSLSDAARIIYRAGLQSERVQALHV